MQPDFLTVPEAAELIRKKPITVYTMVMKKQIPFFKIGRAVLFNRVELMNWIEGKRCKTNAELNEIVQQTSSKRAVRTK